MTLEAPIEQHVDTACRRPIVTSNGSDDAISSLPVPDHETICGHEAAHAVMRWICGEQCTMIESDEQGGFCHGTGKRIRAENALLIVLAGFAYETGYGLAKPVFETSDADDIDVARRLIRQHDYLRAYFAEAGPDGSPLFLDGDPLLTKWFDRACDLLAPFNPVVEIIACRLEYRGKMTARSVAATIREAVKRQGLSRR